MPTDILRYRGKPDSAAFGAGGVIWYDRTDSVENAAPLWDVSYNPKNILDVIVRL